MSRRTLEILKKRCRTKTAVGSFRRSDPHLDTRSRSATCFGKPEIGHDLRRNWGCTAHDMATALGFLRALETSLRSFAQWVIEM